MFTVVPTVHVIHEVVLLIWEKGPMQIFSLILKRAIKIYGNAGQSHISKENGKCMLKRKEKHRNVCDVTAG